MSEKTVTPSQGAIRAAVEIYESICHIDGPNASTLAAIIDREANQWQPIETAPMNGTMLLMWGRADTDKPCIHIASWWTHHGAWLTPDATFSDPTHWLPLPQPPTT